MRYPLPLLIVAAISILGCRPTPGTLGQSSQLRPDLPPTIHIRSVEVPQADSQPLSVSFELVPAGKTPVAISCANFAFEISRPGIYSEEYGDLLFSNAVPKVIVVQPGTNLVVNAMILTNSSNQHWDRYGPGKYGLKISTGSGKQRHFDYEWMGQLHSDRCDFELR